MVTQNNIVNCMVFLREKGRLEIKEGLGVHPFGRVPIVGEYVALSSKEPVYKVTHVRHTGFGTHQAELFVVEADDVQVIGGEPIPMP
jgi:hypothetical protein